MYRRNALVLLTVAVTGCAAAPISTMTDWVVSIEAKVPGRSAEYIEAKITIPLESALNNLPEVVRLMSSAYEGACAMEVAFVTHPTGLQLKSVTQVVQSQLGSKDPGLPEPIVTIQKRRLQ